MNLVALCVLSIATLGAGGRGQVLEFSSEHCGPCQQVAPIVAKLEREGLPIHSIDVNADQAAASQYRITTIPAFVLIVDNREVERLTGSQSESRIRQMLARIPAGESRSNPQGGQLPIDLGKSAPIPRPDSLGKTTSREGARSADNEGSRLWPFSKPKSPKKPDVYRGNDPEPMPPSGTVEVMPANAMDASVRLRIVTGDSEVKGSGTVIESRPGQTVILTCSHVLRGANADSRVEVDLFRNGKPVEYLGSIVGSDPEADVGLITIRTAEDIYPAIPVAGLDQNPAAGAQVVSIGCGGGEAPSRQQLRVTEVNRYKGPDTLVCTGVPVQGRSGGGLFDENGSLVGVCFAADESGNRGVYCGLRPIHDLLTKYRFTHLVPQAAPDAALAQTDPTAESLPESHPGDPNPMPKGDETFPDAALAANPSAPESRPAAESYAADDAEVVVVIRSRSAGSQGDKVILIHKPSQQFLNFVQGELGDTSAVGTTTKASTGVPEARVTRVVKPRPTTQDLQTTGLKSPSTPRAYIRAVQ
jgi:thiol-disulfide isomerase/thioredoxin